MPSGSHGRQNAAMKQPNGNRRVVIVDDNRGFRAAADVFLRTLDGVEVVGFAADGLQGLELIDRVEPDAAIVDISMPGLNGFELAAQLRKPPAGPGIILVSMNVDQATRSEAHRLGVDGVVAKADFVEQLPQLLEAIFLKSGPRGILQAPDKTERHS
jgi:DNA-binding NarL/FixJ family response regulator